MSARAPMRVGLVCPYSWRRPGGVRAHVRGLARSLAACGHEVEIVAPDGRGDTLPVVDAGPSLSLRDNGSIVPVALGPGAVARTARLVRSRGYDLVHVHEPMIPAVALTAVLAARAPLVGTFHMYAASPRWYRPFAPLARRALARLAVRVAVSEAARWHVARVVPGEYRIVPNGVDVEALSSHPPSRGGSRLLFLGRSEPRKGLPVLLEAFGRLPGGVVLHLGGVDEAELAAAATGLSGEARRRIRAHGHVDAGTKARLLAEADVLCVPSLQGESFGIVLVEGMAAGVPVVASDVPGYRLVLPEDAGRLVPPGESGALAAALEELLADAALRETLGRRGREEARRYDWSRVTAELLDVYEEACRGGYTHVGRREALDVS